MNWKRFKSFDRSEKRDETSFIIGMDIGNDSSAIAYFDVNSDVPEIVDMSGGYGRPSVPTVMQYVAETKEWVFGEYAVLNKGLGQEVTLHALVEKLGKREYVEIDKKPVSVVNILSLYIKELMGSIKNINPKAEIAGIVVATPVYLSEEAKEELVWAFKNAGYEKELIELAPDRECIFANYFYKEMTADQRVLLIDYGSREVRGGVYDLRAEADVVRVKDLSSLFDEEIGTNEINNSITALFTDFYCLEAMAMPAKLSEPIKDQLSAFVYQHKDLLFQKMIQQRPVKLYFNFVYPPFQRTVTKAHVEEIIDPYRDRFISFINNILEKNIYDGKKMNAGDISAVLCTGGGFEMLWAREVIGEIFPDSRKLFYKNAKAVLAEGAAIIAARRLDVIDSQDYQVEDLHQTTEDIGIRVAHRHRDRFLPIVERNAFLWQKHPGKLLLINEQVQSPFEIEILTRNAEGDLRVVDHISLDGLPERPKGTTRLGLTMEFLSFGEISATVTDHGFGELFPKSGYEKKVNILLNQKNDTEVSR